MLIRVAVAALLLALPVAAKKPAESVGAVSLAPPPPDDFGKMSGEPGLPPVAIPPPPGKPPKPPKSAPAEPPPEPAPPPK